MVPKNTVIQNVRKVLIHLHTKAGPHYPVRWYKEVNTEI